MFNQLYKKIVEEEDIFKASTPEEGVRRKQQFLELEFEKLLKDPKLHKNPDGSYDYYGDLSIRDLELEEIPLPFNIVGGFFDCTNNYLTSLVGCPKIVDLWFDCSMNASLTSLKGAPEEIGGDFWCDDNYQITSLEGCPKKVGGHFSIDCSSGKFNDRDIRKICEIGGKVVLSH